jgi:hypothetical protein
MFDFLVACYNVGADYHSGMFSKGYRLMCQSAIACRRWFDYDPTLDDEMTENQQRIYFQLAKRHQRWL